MSINKFRKSIQGLEFTKGDKVNYIPGILGFTLAGENKVEVPTREGYVYIRVRGSESEVIQAYNDAVSPVYGLPVLFAKDDIDKTRYRVIARDTGAYQNWGSSSPYLPRHGHTHSFIPEEGGGGDVVWIYSRQLMPFAAYPSGSSGAGNVIIKPAMYYAEGWHYVGGTGTGDILTYKPTDNTARMVLVYIDGDGNPGLVASDDYFTASITGNAGIVPYMPLPASTDHIPVAGIRLVSGTSKISWGNIYDARPWLVADGFIATGSSAPLNSPFVTVGNDGTLSAERALVAGTGLYVHDYGANSSVEVGIITGTIGGVIGFSVPGTLAIGGVTVRNLAPRAGIIQNVTASVYSASTGSSVIVDINKNGSTIFSTQANRPTILAGTYDDLYSHPNTTTFVQNDVFTLDVDAVGISGAGSDLQVQIRYII